MIFILKENSEKSNVNLNLGFILIDQHKVFLT